MAQNTQPELKNRLIAGISYILLSFGILGVIIDVIIYYTSKDKYAKFHAGQAAWLTAVFILVGIIFGISTGMMQTGNAITDLAKTMQMAVIINYAKLGILVICAGMAFMGRNFRIPIAADILEK